VLVLSVLHFQLGWVVSDEMGASYNAREIGDNLIKMRVAIWLTDTVVNQAIARPWRFL
jgi:hypothetical protein